MALTPQQQIFVTAYLDGGMANASDAYRKAYPTSEKWSAVAVSRKAAASLLNGSIRRVIDAARAKAENKMAAAEDRFAVSRERISRELARLAFSDHRRLFEWDKDGVIVRASADLSDDEAAAVIEVSQTITAEGGTIRVKLADKRQALMDLAKLHGHIVEKREIRRINDWSELSDEELAALAKSVPPIEKGTRH